MLNCDTSKCPLSDPHRGNFQKNGHFQKNGGSGSHYSNVLLEIKRTKSDKYDILTNMRYHCDLNMETKYSRRVSERSDNAVFLTFFYIYLSQKIDQVNSASLSSKRLQDIY